MRKIFLILFLSFVVLSFSNILWHEASEASITILENATPLNEASFTVKNIAFTYKGIYEISDGSTNGYLVVFKAKNTSDSIVFLLNLDIGEAFDKSTFYTPLDQFSSYIEKYGIDLVFNSYEPKKTLLVGFFIPEPPEKIVGINFLNHYYKWNDEDVLPIENLIEETKNNSKTAISILEFRDYPLGKTTINDVLEKEGEPWYKNTVNNVTHLIYKDKLLDRDCFVTYSFNGKGLLYSGGYIFEFETGEINEMSRVFKRIKDILNEKYGKGTLNIEGYAKNLIEDVDDEYTMLLVMSEAMSINVFWLLDVDEYTIGLSAVGKALKGQIYVLYIDNLTSPTNSDSDNSEEDAF